MTKMAVLTVSPELLIELLHIPPEAKVLDIRVPFSNPGVLELKVEGVGWETPNGAAIMFAPPAEITQSGCAIEIDWKVPKC
jgi:hypothetical protein